MCLECSSEIVAAALQAAGRIPHDAETSTMVPGTCTAIYAVTVTDSLLAADFQKPDLGIPGQEALIGGAIELVEVIRLLG